ncbi:molybdopterin-dependent oxidoreductase [Tunturiibacter gelidiferens]|uniref:molybdopterin-dependent oxidoreductase n=1 Tax=Tunturiibacter gelidiferens TaxID=3069689 RepID=UPI003D9ABED4
MDTGRNHEATRLQAAGSEDSNPTDPEAAETRHAVESIEQPAKADGSLSSRVGHTLQTDEAASSVPAKQEMAESGPENTPPSAPEAIQKPEAVETIEQPADAVELPSLSVDHERRMDEAASSAAVKSVSPKKPQSFLGEQPLPIVETAPLVLRYRTRRDLLLFGAGAVVAVAGAGLLLPQATLGRLGVRRKINPRGKEWLLNKAVRIDDDVAEALYSQNRTVPTYPKSQITPIKNNYNGATPDPSYISGWNVTLEGLDSGLSVRLDIRKLMNRFPIHEQITRFVCVEGWSAVAWWAGLRFDDLLHAYPPISQAKWARVESSVNLDNSGNLDPYFVSIDLTTARHPQTLLVTHHNGQPLMVEHGAPLRLLVPVKLGLKNVKAITRITYSAEEPKDYWTQYGYSSYDGI